MAKVNILCPDLIEEYGLDESEIIKELGKVNAEKDVEGMIKGLPENLMYTLVYRVKSQKIFLTNIIKAEKVIKMDNSKLFAHM
ncbi:hypothetical protein PRVXT_000225 [Proteinivorax tanatarense]|uniref:Uncharacterized protein n=1 Tax=Proteinivorax tanatarense TaxID=1260629 RepID=A0AAU7VLX2_9FIRM